MRTIRLDESDTRVFARAARPGEWAIPGTFAFVDSDPEALEGKALQAFKHGFLGLETFGWSTLVTIAELGDDEYQLLVDKLAGHFIDAYGAPHIAAALPKAAEEIDAIVSMLDGEMHTLLAMDREFSDAGVVERLRRVDPKASDHAQLRFWKMVED